MAKEMYDIVVVGGGHNGLIVAAYLAKAGQKVCVVERLDKVGGGAVTREVTAPGFKQDICSMFHQFIQANPLIAKDELGLLSKYGLSYIYPDPIFAFIFPDERSLVIYHDINKTRESIAQFSSKDADAYPKFCEFASKAIKGAEISHFSPPPPFGRFISFLEASEIGREYLRIMQFSPMDILNEWFESEQVKLAFARHATCIMAGPRDRACGWLSFALANFQTGQGTAIPVGGSGAISDALATCLQDYGGVIRLSSTVKAIKVEHGEAKGAILENGDEILARKAVISNLNVKQLLMDMVKPDVLPTGFPEKVRNLKRDSFSALHQVLALNESPKYKVGGDVNKALLVEIVPSLEEFLRTFDDLAYGIPNNKTPILGCATLFDPSRAPKGKHTLYVYQYEPYHLKDGGVERWDEIKQKVADDILAKVRQHATNMGPENILGRQIYSPLDLERYNPAFREGSIHHLCETLPQYMSNRPLNGWAQYRTPVKKLYMCGASTHPGGGINGSGRAAVQSVMEDLGIDFNKVIAK
jgi:phytoene dehydrogenase-like protein